MPVLVDSQKLELQLTVWVANYGAENETRTTDKITTSKLKITKKTNINNKIQKIKWWQCLFIGLFFKIKKSSVL